ncbi:MAG: glycosyltransferase [Candidatus Aenigmarchaeota archaeon]|nr:glycosyltransferase [Candidatus Aenigmarchaeota archaeon]
MAAYRGNKKRVLMILSNPLLVDPRVHKEAKVLVENGYKVTVIVWDRHNEYKEKDIIDDIEVIRLRISKLSGSIHGKLIKIILWWKKVYKEISRLLREGYQFDVIHCHDLDTLLVGVLLKRRLNLKLIYDAHEIYGYMLKDDHPLISKFAFVLEKLLVKFVDHIITIDEPFKEYFEKFNKPVTIVMNCKDLIYNEYSPPNNPVFTLVYIGLMSKGRFFPDILDVVGNLENVKLILAGKKEGLFEEIKNYSKRFDNIEFLGTIPSSKILPLTRKADATFVITDLKGQHKMNVFNKQFEAMVCGRPIIVTKGTYAGKMTEELKCGLTVDYDRDSVRDAIVKLRDNPDLCRKLGENAFKAAKERYNWDVEKKKLLEVYRAILWA